MPNAQAPSSLLGRRVRVSYVRSLGLVTDPAASMDLTQRVVAPVVGVLLEMRTGAPLVVQVGGRTWSTSQLRQVQQAGDVAEVITRRGSVYLIRPIR
ncbi:MAG: hypothetical protein RMK29_17715 [Myxococcales bacterium]|nr:hypothetical protein [Myxococcota bacterium]MDW8283548.1 hypothetical protein [Myxococcales bacterium]